MTQDKLATIKTSEDIERHSIEAYARRNELSVEEVWRLIEEGCLRARKVGQTIIVLNATFSIDEELLPQNLSTETKLLPEVIGDIAAADDLNSLRQFAVAAMDQIGHLQQELGQSKNKIIAHQEEKIKGLEKSHDELSLENRKLSQELEDIKILNQLLSDDHRSEKR